MTLHRSLRARIERRSIASDRRQGRLALVLAFASQLGTMALTVAHYLV